MYSAGDFLPILVALSPGTGGIRSEDEIIPVYFSINIIVVL
jgi:hypothetical protein